MDMPSKSLSIWNTPVIGSTELGLKYISEKILARLSALLLKENNSLENALCANQLYRSYLGNRNNPADQQDLKTISGQVAL